MRDLTKENPFGRWVVLRRSEKKSRWVCECECGNVRDVLTQTLTSGRSTQCEECRLRQLESRKIKYPWDEWLSGKVATVDAEAQYNVAPQMLAQSLYKKAKDRGLAVNVKIEGNEITFHFREQSDPQIIKAHGGRSGGRPRKAELAAEIARRRKCGEKLKDIASDLGMKVAAASILLKRHGYRR